MIKIIQITDPHLLKDQNDSFRDVKPFETLKLVIDRIKRSNWGCDMVIATGDLTQDNTKESYIHYIKF